MALNEVTKPKDTKEPEAKSLMSIQKNYVTGISKGLSDIIKDMTTYRALCGYNMLNSISVQLAKEGKHFKSPGIDTESINNAIKFAIVYQLNTENKECFVILRNEKRKDANGKEYYIKVADYKPQYKGTLKILSTYGLNVAQVYPEWIVREGDEFEYQTFKGIDVVPPVWKPHSSDGKILRVIVPIRYKNGFVDYRIAERESVATNIKAQIKQSVMFDKKKDEILAKIQNMTLDELLNDPTLKGYVNETYTGISQEEMLITKLVINAVKRVQIDYQSALARELNEKTFDNADVYKKNHNAEEMLAAGNAPMIDMQEVEFEEKPAEEEPAEEKTDSKPEVDEDGVVVDTRKKDDGFVSLFDQTENK